MAETKELQSSQEIKESNQYTQEDLEGLLIQLGEIEQELFGGDGVIDLGASNGDTTLENTLIKEIEGIQDINKKVEIVKQMYESFSIDSKPKIKDIKIKYPEYSMVIDDFVSKNNDIDFKVLGTTIDLIKNGYTFLDTNKDLLTQSARWESSSIFEDIYMEVFFVDSNGDDFYLNKVLKYDFINEFDNNDFALFVLKNHKSLGDLDSFENIISNIDGKELTKENKDELYEYIDNNITDNYLSSKLISYIDEKYGNKHIFREFFIERKKEENFSFIDNLDLENFKGTLEAIMYAMNKSDIDYIEPFMVEFFNTDKENRLSIYNNFISNFTDSKKIIIDTRLYGVLGILGFMAGKGNTVQNELTTIRNNKIDLAKQNINLGNDKKNKIASDLVEGYKKDTNNNNNPSLLTYINQRNTELEPEEIRTLVNQVYGEFSNPQIPKTPSSKNPELSQIDSKINSLKQKYGNIAQELFNSEKISFDKNGEIKIDGRIDFLGGTIEMSKDGKDFIVNNAGCKREIKVDSLGNTLETIKRLDKINKTGLSHLGDTMFDVIDSICNVRSDLTYENIFYGNKINPFLGVLNQIIPTGYVDYSISPIVITKEKYINDYLSVKINTDMDRVNTSGNLTITPRDLQRHIFNTLRNIG